MIPRFLKEYANYQKKAYQNSEYMHPIIKQYYISMIDEILKDRKNGLITVDEAMRMIADPGDPPQSIREAAELLTA